MTKWSMHVAVAVRFGPGLVFGVGVLMVLVMPVKVVVSEGFVNVLVVVPFREVEPYAQGHQSGRDEQGDRQRLAEHQDAPDGTYERRRREIRAGASGPQKT